MGDFDRQLPDWLDGWNAFMSNSEAPTIFNKWVGVSMIAAVLERKCYLNWDKQLFPNFYIVLVGPPGCRKGTAMGPGRKLLEEMNIKLVAEATTREVLIKRLKDSRENYENLELNEIHAYSAMTCFSEELTVFLGYNQQQLMQDLANWYDCVPKWKYDTKHQGTDDIEGVYFNLCGATTPKLLRESMPVESFGGGLNSRIIYVYAREKGALVIFPFLKKEQPELYEKLNQDLQWIRLMSGEFKPEQSFLDSWEAWYPKQFNNALKDNEKMQGYLERRPTHLLKLGMIINASRGGDMKLTDEDFTRGLTLLEEVEIKMPQTFEGMGQSKTSDLNIRMMHYIRDKGTVPYPVLLKTFIDDADDSLLAALVATFAKAGLLDTERLENGQILIHYKD